MTGPVKYHLGDFPPQAESINWAQLVPMIGQANAAIARYDGLIAAIPNANVLLSPLTTQEAVLSSRIEGTNVTMGEVLEVEAGVDTTQPKRDDAEEVLNYRIALRFAEHALVDRTLSHHLLREAHALLLKGVRGRDKNPGAFRTKQNWIGPRHCTIEEANFVPIQQEHLQAGLDLWASYINSTDELDPLIQLAIIHLEFEAIHPFEDGNGRLGRMIIPLFLMQRGLLSSPSFYMSQYLESNREEYIERMRSVSSNRDWTGWCAFFLRGIINQAKSNQDKAQKIIDLHQVMLPRVSDLTRSQHSGRAVEFLLTNPVFNSNTFVRDSGIPRATGLRIIQILRDEGLIETARESAGNRPALYAFMELLRIAEGI